MGVVAERLRSARQKKGLSQMEVMRLTQINNKTLSGYENAVSDPDLDTLVMLANLYAVSTDYLLGKVANPHDELVPNRPATPSDLAGEIIGTITAERQAKDNAIAFISDAAGIAGTLQDRLRILREENKLTRSEMSEKTRSSQDQIYNWESGRGEPDSEMLKQIADTFDVSVDWLVGKSNLRSPRPTTIALSRSDDPDSDLPDEALKQIEDFRAFIRQKYKKPD